MGRDPERDDGRVTAQATSGERGTPAPVSPVTGISLKVASVASFSIMFVLIKAAGDVPAGQAVFFRSFFAIFPIVIVLAFRRELAGAFRTSRPVSHFMRGAIGVVAMSLGFFALTRLPLPEAITLQYAQPLLVVVLGALFMGETVRLYRWTAVAVGLCGVLIISWPNLTLLAGDTPIGRAQALGAAAAIAAAGFSAATVLLVRRLVYTERTPTIVLWFSMTASLFGLCTLPFGWVLPSLEQTALLVASGVIGGFGQIMLTESYRHAPMSTIAPFEYTSILFGALLGYIVFGDVPGGNMIVGGIIVVGAGLFIIWREQRLGLERAAARKVTPPQ